MRPSRPLSIMRRTVFGIRLSPSAIRRPIQPLPMTPQIRHYREVPYSAGRTTSRLIKVGRARVHHQAMHYSASNRRRPRIGTTSRGRLAPLCCLLWTAQSVGSRSASTECRPPAAALNFRIERVTILTWPAGNRAHVVNRQTGLFFEDRSGPSRITAPAENRSYLRKRRWSNYLPSNLATKWGDRQAGKGSRVSLGPSSITLSRYNKNSRDLSLVTWRG